MPPSARTSGFLRNLEAMVALNDMDDKSESDVICCSSWQTSSLSTVLTESKYLDNRSAFSDACIIDSSNLRVASSLT